MIQSIRVFVSAGFGSGPSFVRVLLHMEQTVLNSAGNFKDAHALSLLADNLSGRLIVFLVASSSFCTRVQLAHIGARGGRTLCR